MYAIDYTPPWSAAAARWMWSVAADERRIGLKRCLGLWKASREELCELGVRSQHVLLKVLLTRRRRRRARRGGGVVDVFDLRDRGQSVLRC